MKNFITNSPQETKELAKDFVPKLKGGEVLGLIGELGAGKTVFVKGLAEGLGIKATVNSPTFVLMKIYDSQKSGVKGQNLVHVDAYRINRPGELLAIGLGEYLSNKNSLVVIEWAEKVKKILPSNSIIINFNIRNNNQRIIRIKR